jgi:hypothetical protein
MLHAPQESGVKNGTRRYYRVVASNGATLCNSKKSAEAAAVVPKKVKKLSAEKAGKGNNASTDPNNGNAFVIDGEVVSGVINFNMLFDGNCGMHITSRRFGINTDYIYLCDRFNGSTIKVGLTQTVTIGDKNLEFIHGMLVGVTENSNGGE